MQRRTFDSAQFQSLLKIVAEEVKACRVSLPFSIPIARIRSQACLIAFKQGVRDAVTKIAKGPESEAFLMHKIMSEENGYLPWEAKALRAKDQ